MEDTTPLAIGTVGSPNTVAAPVAFALANGHGRYPDDPADELDTAAFRCPCMDPIRDVVKLG